MRQQASVLGKFMYKDGFMLFSVTGTENFSGLSKYAIFILMSELLTFLQISKIGSAQGSPATPPLSKECLPRNFHRPTGLAYSSSDSLDQHASRQYYESCGLASTPKLSNISASKTETSSIDASVRSSLSREVDHSGELSASIASDVETEWVEQDEPGVYITIRALPNGSRELRRVRFR